MEQKKERSSLRKKLYLFIIVSVFVASFGASLLSFFINADQIDNYFKKLTLDSARTFSKFVDVDYMSRLREVAESPEYQELRNRAEEEDNEALIEEYLKGKGLWDEYVQNRQVMIDYVSDMEDIKYLYIVVWGDFDSICDMYLLDADDVPIYETGYYEEREEELLGTDASKEVEPSISHGDWGWLCSAFVPVCDENGNIVCQVGCDVGMDDIMKERRTNLIYDLLSAVGITALVYIISTLLIRSAVITPIKTLAEELKKFKPASNKNYEESGVVDIKLKNKDEINDLYVEIRSMQVRIVDHIKDIAIMKQDKAKVETELKIKEKEMGKVSMEALRDSLTCVGNKNAFDKKSNELNEKIADEEVGNDDLKFAIVMMDVNRLKYINDTYGHKEGDEYLKGCCRILCNVFKHSPVYRIGGDEFVAILQGGDYEEREDKLALLNSSFMESFLKEDNKTWERYSAAAGMSEYDPSDETIDDAFNRADRIMYDEKQRFKAKYSL